MKDITGTVTVTRCSLVSEMLDTIVEMKAARKEGAQFLARYCGEDVS